jgi:hypothetical protein
VSATFNPFCPVVAAALDEVRERIFPEVAELAVINPALPVVAPDVVKKSPLLST